MLSHLVSIPYSALITCLCSTIMQHMDVMSVKGRIQVKFNSLRIGFVDFHASKHSCISQRLLQQ